MAYTNINVLGGLLGKGQLGLQRQQQGLAGLSTTNAATGYYNYGNGTVTIAPEPYMPKLTAMTDKNGEDWLVDYARDYRRKETALEWLDRRVTEMRVAL